MIGWNLLTQKGKGKGRSHPNSSEFVYFIQRIANILCLFTDRNVLNTWMGDTLVNSSPMDQRVTGSNPVLIVDKTF